MKRPVSLQQRTLAAAVATLWLALPFGALLHATHQHEICAEHGVLEEKSGESNGEGLRVTAATPEHQACAALAATSRAPTQNPRIEAPVPFWSAYALLAVEEPRDAVAPLALLSVAPKLSPPRA